LRAFFFLEIAKNSSPEMQKKKQNKTKQEKQKNSRAKGRALKSAVRTLIDKLASQIVRLKAIVRT